MLNIKIKILGIFLLRQKSIVRFNFKQGDEKQYSYWRKLNDYLFLIKVLSKSPRNDNMITSRYMINEEGRD